MALHSVEKPAEPDALPQRLNFADDSNQPLRNGFSHFFSSQKPIFSLSRKIWNPPTDIREGRDCIFIRMEVAGISEENLTILMEDNILTVRGIRLEDSDDEEVDFHLLEIHYGQFERKFIMPRGANIDQIQADYAKGFLNIAIPKLQRDLSPIAIDVQTSGTPSPKS